MSFDYKSKYRKWLIVKSNEERILKSEGWDESKIEELRKYDYKLFNDERRFHRNNRLYDDIYFTQKPIFDRCQIYSTKKIIDSIENIKMIEYFKSLDNDYVIILDLKLQGYTAKEISKITGFSIHKVYNSIRKIKNDIKLYKKSCS